MNNQVQAPNERAAHSDLIPAKPRVGDKVFTGLSTGSGVTILVILAAVAAFLLLRALPALTASADDIAARGYTSNLAWLDGFWGWVLPLAFGTIWAALGALALAVPVSIGIALFISHYAPRRLAQTLGYVIDLLAAVPSVVFGLWGINVLAPMVQPAFVWLNKTFGGVPVLGWFFGGQVSGTGRTILTAAIVLAVMVLPIITAVTREVFLQTPRLHEEASLALGATRWEMIRQAVLPFGMPGIVSACMLGLGRALGETMAVAMVLSPGDGFHLKLLTSSNPNSIAANIALKFPEAYGLGVNQLIASGLILFVITLGVNMAARAIVARRAEFSGAN